MEILKWYIILILAPLMVLAGKNQFKACVIAEAGPAFKGIFLGIISMSHGLALMYIFTKYFNIITFF